MSRRHGTELFEKEACVRRLAVVLSKKFRGVSKTIGLVPYLIEDDRIACEYADIDPDSGKKVGVKLLVGGYFRFYSQGENMIYLSPFKRSMQIGLLEALGSAGRKMSYLKWDVSLIVKLYIKESTEERVRADVTARPLHKRSESTGDMHGLTVSAPPSPVTGDRKTSSLSPNPRTRVMGDRKVSIGGARALATLPEGRPTS